MFSGVSEIFIYLFIIIKEWCHFNTTGITFKFWVLKEYGIYIIWIIITIILLKNRTTKKIRKDLRVVNNKGS